MCKAEFVYKINHGKVLGLAGVNISELGESKYERASTIDFDPSTKTWFVALSHCQHNEPYCGKIIGYNFPVRELAVAFEHTWLTAHILSGEDWSGLPYKWEEQR